MSEIKKIIDETEKEKKTKTERNKGVAQDIVKVWQLIGFVDCLRYVGYIVYRLYLIDM